MKIYIIQKGEHSDRRIIEITDDKKEVWKRVFRQVDIVA